MRTWLLAALLVLGCGDDGGSGPDIDAAPGTIDAAPMADADPGATPGQIACGDGVFCTAPEVCCGNLDAQSCTASDACDEFAFSCDDPTDCGGGMQGCCVTNEGASCVERASCTGALLCNEDDDCPDSTCGMLQICLP